MAGLLPAYQQAGAQIDAQKRALLAAVAHQGSAGLAQVQNQADAAQQMRAQAIEGINASGADPRLVAQMRGQAAGTADLYATDAGEAGTALGSEMQRIQAAGASYMDQAAAAAPIASATTEREVARLKKEQMEEEANRVLERQRLESGLESDRVALQTAREAQANAREAHGWDVTANTHEENMAAIDERTARLGLRTARVNASSTPAPPRSAQEIEEDYGIKKEDQAGMVTNPSYAPLEATLTYAFQQGMTAGQARQQLEKKEQALAEESGHHYGRTVEYLWAKYGHRFPGE